MGEVKWDDLKIFYTGEKKLSDGRVIHCEKWRECGETFLTYTFCSTGLEGRTKEQIVNYLLAQGIDLNAETPLSNIELITSSSGNYRITIKVK